MPRHFPSTVAGTVEHEIVVTRSRFLTTIAPVTGVEDADSAPPAASWICVPPAAPEPMNEPITASTALTATVDCRIRSARVGDVVAVMSLLN